MSSSCSNLPGWRWKRIKQLFLVGSSSSLHSEVCNALGGVSASPTAKFLSSDTCVRALSTSAAPCQCNSNHPRVTTFVRAFWFAPSSCNSNDPRATPFVQYRRDAPNVSVRQTKSTQRHNILARHSSLAVGRAATYLAGAGRGSSSSFS